MRVRLCAALLLVLATVTAAKADEPPVTEAGFEFHSGLWINLHHFLYEQAFWREQLASGKPEMAAVAKKRLADTSALTAGQRRAWDAALDYYAKVMTPRDVLFDVGMIDVKNHLAAAEGKPDLSGAGLDAALRGALEGAAPVYRAVWWPQHDRSNRAWIAAVRPLARAYRDTLAPRLAAAYRATWPRAPIRVDVSIWAHRVGAYTTTDPLHVTISSVHPNNQGYVALEILFHETSHAMVDDRSSAVGEAIARAAKARNTAPPDGLWHAVLFYTTGELVRRALADGGVRDYEPYAYHYGLYARDPKWDRYRRALERTWLPYLDGKADFDAAVTRLVDDVVTDADSVLRDAGYSVPGPRRKMP